MFKVSATIPDCTPREFPQVMKRIQELCGEKPEPYNDGSFIITVETGDRAQQIFDLLNANNYKTRGKPWRVLGS